MERTGRFFKLTTRIIAEMGCQIVKTTDFEEVVAACPVQLFVMAARSLLSATLCTLRRRYPARAHAALTWAATSSRQMAEAVRMIVHEGATDAPGMGVLRGLWPTKSTHGAARRAQVPRPPVTKAQRAQMLLMREALM